MKLTGKDDGSTKGLILDGEGDIIIAFNSPERKDYGLHIEHVNESTFKNLTIVGLPMDTYRGLFFAALFKAWLWLYRLGMKETRLPDIP